MSSPTEGLTIFYKSLDNLLTHFPDPFETLDIKQKPDAKALLVIEQVAVRKKMNTVLKNVRKLLITSTQLNEMKKRWRELEILKTYYLPRFDSSNPHTFLSTEKDMKAYLLLKQLIMEYEFILKTLNEKIKNPTSFG
jgi:hypothetical protein